MTPPLNFCIRCGAPLRLRSLAHAQAVRQFTWLLTLIVYTLAYFGAMAYLIFWLAS
jgi:hypothetical protein